MQQLDLGFDPNSDDNALLHIVCAHGAKSVCSSPSISSSFWTSAEGRLIRFSALEYSRNVQRLPAKLIQSAGHEWAKTAERLLLADYGKISVSNLMVSWSMPFLHLEGPSKVVASRCLLLSSPPDICTPL